PKPALLTTTSGSSPRSSSAAAIVCAASRRARSAPRTVGRGARFAAMASASAPSTRSRLATRTSSWPWAANSCANAAPIPADAPAAILVKKAIDQAGEVIEIHGLVLGRSRLGDQFIRRRLVELKLLLDDRMQLVALGVGNVAVDRSRMNEQRCRSEAVVAVVEPSRMLLAFRHFGQKFAKALEHGAANRCNAPRCMLPERSP